MNASMNTSSTKGRWAAIVGLLSASAIGGAVLAGPGSANAATTATPSTAASAPSSSSTSIGSAKPAHGTAAEEGLETPVTGTNATKAQAAAVAAVGSGTAGAVTTDMSGNGFEVTVAKADGSSVEVHLNSAFSVIGHGGFGGTAANGSTSAAE